MEINNLNSIIAYFYFGIGSHIHINRSSFGLNKEPSISRGEESQSAVPWNSKHFPFLAFYIQIH